MTSTLSRDLDSSTSSVAYYDPDVAPGTNILWCFIPRISSCLKGITAKELRLHLFFVHISNHKWLADVRKLSSHAPSPEIVRMTLLMVGHLLLFSGPLSTRQWNCAELGKLLPVWFMALASSLFPHFHKHQILLENLGGNLPILSYFGVSSSSLDLWFDKPNNKMKNGFCSLDHDYQPGQAAWGRGNKKATPFEVKGSELVAKEKLEVNDVKCG